MADSVNPNTPPLSDPDWMGMFQPARRIGMGTDRSFTSPDDAETREWAIDYLKKMLPQRRPSGDYERDLFIGEDPSMRGNTSNYTPAPGGGSGPLINQSPDLGMLGALINQAPRLGLGGPQINAPPALGLNNALVNRAPNLGLGNANISQSPPSQGIQDLINKAIINVKLPRAPNPDNFAESLSSNFGGKSPEGNAELYTGQDLEDFLHRKLAAFPDLADALYGTGAVNVAVTADPGVGYDEVADEIDKMTGRKRWVAPSKGDFTHNAYHWSYPSGADRPEMINTIGFDRRRQGSPIALHEALHSAAETSNRAAGLPRDSNDQWRPHYGLIGQMNELADAVYGINGYDIYNPKRRSEIPTTLGEASYVAQDPGFDSMVQNPYYHWARFFKAQREGKDPINVSRAAGMTNRPMSGPLRPIPQDQIDYAATYRDNLINTIIKHYVQGYRENAPPGLRQ